MRVVGVGVAVLHADVGDAERVEHAQHGAVGGHGGDGHHPAPPALRGACGGLFECTWCSKSTNCVMRVLVNQ